MVMLKNIQGHEAILEKTNNLFGCLNREISGDIELGMVDSQLKHVTKKTGEKITIRDIKAMYTKIEEFSRVVSGCENLSKDDKRKLQYSVLVTLNKLVHNAINAIDREGTGGLLRGELLEIQHFIVGKCQALVRSLDVDLGHVKELVRMAERAAGSSVAGALMEGVRSVGKAVMPGQLPCLNFKTDDFDFTASLDRFEGKYVHLETPKPKNTEEAIEDIEMAIGVLRTAIGEIHQKALKEKRTEGLQEKLEAEVKACIGQLEAHGIKVTSFQANGIDDDGETVEFDSVTTTEDIIAQLRDYTNEELNIGFELTDVEQHDNRQRVRAPRATGECKIERMF